MESLHEAVRERARGTRSPMLDAHGTQVELEEMNILAATILSTAIG